MAAKEAQFVAYYRVSTERQGESGLGLAALHSPRGLLQRLAPTLLVDGDSTRSATKWSQRGTGQGLPFKVIPAAQMAKHLRHYEHVVIDTEANPSDEDFRELADGCDLMVILAQPETVATDGPIHTLEKLQAPQGGTVQGTSDQGATPSTYGRQAAPGDPDH